MNRKISRYRVTARPHYPEIFSDILQRWRKTDADIFHDAKGVRWKIEIAQQLRLEASAPYQWIAQNLKTISPAALRVAVCRLANK